MGEWARSESIGDHVGSTDEMSASLERVQAELDRIRTALGPTEVPSSAAQPQAIAARQVLQARRAREAAFGPGLFSDPAWDILLAAYAARMEQHGTALNDLCNAAAVPSSTALRWVFKLEQEGWLRRQDDLFDGRRSCVEITDKGAAAMERLAANAPIKWAI